MRSSACLVFAATMMGCDSGSPAAPAAPPAVPSIVAVGPQVLRITLHSRCTLPPGALPMLYTRVTVARFGNGWVASANGATEGDVQVRFQPSGGGIPGTMRVAGTITGTAVHMPELLPVPSSAVQMNFGADGSAVLDGIAFTAGSLNATTAGLDGVGTGSLVVFAGTTDPSCTASAFSWSIFPPPS